MHKKYFVCILQYTQRNMHTVFALLCFVVVIHWLIFPYPSGLLHWHCGNLTIAPVPAKQPWWIWINTSCEFIMNDYITTTKQSTTKPCAYFLGYTVSPASVTICNLIFVYGDTLCYFCIREVIASWYHFFQESPVNTPPNKIIFDFPTTQSVLPTLSVFMVLMSLSDILPCQRLDRLPRRHNGQYIRRVCVIQIFRYACSTIIDLSPWLLSLIHVRRVTHIWVNKLGHHSFRWCYV